MLHTKTSDKINLLQSFLITTLYSTCFITLLKINHTILNFYFSYYRLFILQLNKNEKTDRKGESLRTTEARTSVVKFSYIYLFGQS